MRLGKAAVFGIAVGTMTIGFAVPAMPAMADPGDVILKPGKVHPGDKVTIVGQKCQVDGEAGSLAFVGGAVPLDGAEEVDGRAGQATIHAQASGTYTVQVRCGGFKSTGLLEVVDRKTALEPQAAPSGGAETGFGGGAGGASTGLLAGGGVLLLGAVGAGAVAARRRNDAAA